MYYLKHRPKTIAEIDNSRARETISKFLASPTLPHALLFIGQKGTGKTSTARIVAKAINCTNRKSGIEPCNTCDHCIAIDSSAAIDVVEMDAASNRGIEEIRKLIHETSFSPMSSTYRVFIVDEAHMITPDAFNALLKTLEEPPESVVFILATTNPEKLPKTIVSRCVKVEFGSARKDDIVTMLKRICEKENIKLQDDKLLNFIADYSDRSFRDAAKIFEELVIQDKLKLDTAQEFLGLVGKQNLIEIMETRDLKEALRWVEEFTQGGGNFKNLIEQLLGELKTLLLVRSGTIEAGEIKTKFSVAEISLLMKLLTQAYADLKITPIESLPLEIAIADFYNNRRASTKS